jgi:hypothetical protein
MNVRELSKVPDSKGIYRPSVLVTHRDEEYEQDGFALLHEMQERHFWYRGRHRFLLAALDRHLPKSAENLRAIDLGGALAAGRAIWPISAHGCFHKWRWLIHR